MLRYAIAAVIVLAILTFGRAEEKKPVKKADSVSFQNDVMPIIKNKCLPCHAEENFNPSELSLDSYELMKEGGKHGPTFVPGKSKESLLFNKLAEEPPFGGRMPLNSRKKIKEGKAKWLTQEEIKSISTWIDQGARNN